MLIPAAVTVITCPLPSKRAPWKPWGWEGGSEEAGADELAAALLPAGFETGRAADDPVAEETDVAETGGTLEKGGPPGKGKAGATEPHELKLPELLTPAIDRTESGAGRDFTIKKAIGTTESIVISRMRSIFLFIGMIPSRIQPEAPSSRNEWVERLSVSQHAKVKCLNILLSVIIAHRF